MAPDQSHPLPALNVRDFGAAGDGERDDTHAFRAALAAAGPTEQTVFVPEGIYLCGTIKLPPHTGLVGNATWGYRTGGGSILRLNDPDAACLLDITGAVGATINGLSLHGKHLGKQVHGICMGPNPDKREEDSPRIERCHISEFSGNGVHLAPVWCFSIRGCEIIRNGGDALHIRGWDGFILDNWFSGNRGHGYHAPEANASITMTGNRIEWNRLGGIRICGGSHYNLTGNYVDRSGGPGIAICGRAGAPSFCITATGNVIYRSGKPDWLDDQTPSCQVLLEESHGISFVANSMCAGQDDGGGTFSPRIGIILRALENAVIKDNTLHLGALEQLIDDRGEHGTGVIIEDNPGRLYQARPGESLWSSGQL